MSSIKIILKKDKVNKKGEAPLYLRIIKDRKAKFVSLGIKINPKDWNPELSRVRKSYPNSQRMNNYIAHKIAEAEGVALEMETNSKFVSPKSIKQNIMGISSVSFLRYFERYIESLFKNGKFSTHTKVKNVFSKLKAYLDNNDLMFDELTVTFLKNYETYLSEQSGNSVNTIHSNLKVIRKLIYDGIREDLFPYEKNPFLKMKLKTENTIKVFLTEDEIKKIEDLDLSEKSRLNLSRNLFVFATYAGGLRFSDILRLKWKDYDGDRILISTQKTKNTVSIKLPNTAKEIIQNYKSDMPIDENYIFPVLKNDIGYSPKSLYNAFVSHNSQINLHLKEIAKMAEINKHVHFHTSRHTFATRALKKGMRIEYVSRLLGHESIKTTQIYAKIVNRDLDDAMDQYFK
jgi:integrase/recombinase XerD